MDIGYLKREVASGNLRSVINILLDQLVGILKYQDAYNTVVQQSASLFRVEKQNDLSIIDSKDYNLEINKIQIRIISLLDELDVKSTSNRPSIKKYYKDIDKKEIKRLSEAIDLSEVGIWEWTKDREYHSPTWKIMLGYSNKDFPQDTHDIWYNLLHPEDKRVANQEFKNYTLGNNDKYEALFRLLCKDGQYKWIASKARVLKFDKNKKPSKIIGIHQDATSLVLDKQNYKSLLQKVNELQQTIKKLNDENNNIKSEISRVFPKHDELLKKLLESLDFLTQEMGEHFTPIYEIMYDMENILNLVNQTVFKDDKVSTSSEKDFHLQSTIEHIVNRLKVVFKGKERTLEETEYVFIDNNILNGHYGQLKGIIYWLIKFIYRNTNAERIKLQVEELVKTDKYPLNPSSIVNFQFEVITVSGDGMSVESLDDLYNYISFQHERSEFIEKELDNGLKQFVNLVKLLQGQIIINPEYSDRSNGISVLLGFNI